MRLLISLALTLSLFGCATSYTSLNGQATGSGHSEIVVGDSANVMGAIEQSIHQQFPASDVRRSSDNSFSWYHQPLLDRTTFRLAVRGAKGVDEQGKAVSGYFYTINTSGTQGLVEARYVTPLNEAIREAMKARRLSWVSVSSLRETSAIEESATAAAKVRACFDDLAASDALAPIRHKVALGSVQDQTFAMLTDSTKPSADEKRAILAWGNGRDRCMVLQRNENQTQGVPVQVRATLDSVATNQQNLLAQLYLGNITYADFAAKRQAVANTANEAIAGIQAELQKQDAAAMDRARQLAAQADQNMILAIGSISQTMAMQQQNNILQQQVTQQSIQNSWSAPTQRLHTTCNFIGSTMFCN